MWNSLDFDYAQQEQRMTDFSGQVFSRKTLERVQMVTNSISLQVNAAYVTTGHFFDTALEENICGPKVDSKIEP